MAEIPHKPGSNTPGNYFHEHCVVCDQRWPCAVELARLLRQVHNVAKRIILDDDLTVFEWNTALKQASAALALVDRWDYSAKKVKLPE